jgi:small ligand-binding sensory domain FIST
MARRDASDVVARAIESSRELVLRSGGREPFFVLQADCTGRGRLLFGDAVTERVIAPVQAPFAPDVPWLGFHSYGEIAPLAGGAHYHNYTMALCAAYDDTPG